MVCMIPVSAKRVSPSTTRSMVKPGALGRSIRRIVASTAESSFRILLSTRSRAAATPGVKIRVELVNTLTFASG